MIAEKRIWILEDDPGVKFVYDEILGIRYKVLYFTALAEFRRALLESPAAEKPELVIADITLPDGCFLHFLSSEEVTNLFETPFIIISSMNDVDALRFCFEEGALDYIIKPFQKSELIVKVERALKRNAVKPPAVEDPWAERILERLPATYGKVPHLTLKEHEILSLFLEAKDYTLSRHEIVKRVWGNVKVYPKTLDVHLYNLRRKIHETGMKIKANGLGRWTLIKKT
ncbi:MAG TPA: response regulator transcription factor [Bdellovibrionota bacterium]|nr:response regulator transcription factor [Bdellovibrionota bacterium]